MKKKQYLKGTKLSNYKIKQIVVHFVVDLTALQTSKLLSLHRNTINRIFNIIRDSICKELLVYDEDETLSGDIEIDESYFGANRVRGKRGRGAKGKTKVFWGVKPPGTLQNLV